MAAKAKRVGQRDIDVRRLLLLAHQDVQVSRLLGVIQVQVGVQEACGRGTATGNQLVVEFQVGVQEACERGNSRRQPVVVARRRNSMNTRRMAASESASNVSSPLQGRPVTVQCCAPKLHTAQCHCYRTQKQGCRGLPVRSAWMVATASTAPAAPSRWPIMDLVELILSDLQQYKEASRQLTARSVREQQAANQS